MNCSGFHKRVPTIKGQSIRMEAGLGGPSPLLGPPGAQDGGGSQDTKGVPCRSPGDRAHTDPVSHTGVTLMPLPPDKQGNASPLALPSPSLLSTALGSILRESKATKLPGPQASSASAPECPRPQLMQEQPSSAKHRWQSQVCIASALRHQKRPLCCGSAMLPHSHLQGLSEHKASPEGVSVERQWVSLFLPSSQGMHRRLGRGAQGPRTGARDSVAIGHSRPHGGSRPNP